MNRRRRGATLTEVVIAVLLLALATTGLLGALYSSVLGQRSGEARFRTAALARELHEELKNFVTADLAVTHGAPGAPSWHLPGDLCAGCAGGASCWALASGCTHDVTARLPADLRDSGMKMSYVVTEVRVAGRTLRRVVVQSDWTPRQ